MMWLLFLVPACAAAALACARLCRMVASAEPAGPAASWRAAGHIDRIGLFETAFLAGGPERVVDLALVLMARRGRLHLAHTGWTSVARPEPKNALEEEVLAAIGPEGQCRTTDLRRAVAEGSSVREVGDRLTQAGLALPAWVREQTAAAVRGVWYALWVTVACMSMAVVAAWLGHSAEHNTPGVVAAWFVLPLLLTTGTLLMSRADVYPYTRWATPAGQEVLRALGGPVRRPALLGRGAGEPWPPSLTEIAIGGPAALRDPRMRAALRPTRTV